jgi:PAS domain S-box-containing protein
MPHCIITRQQFSPELDMDSNEMSKEMEKCKERLKHFMLLLDESMDPTFSFYPDGTYRYVNKAFATGVGKTPEEIIGRKIWDVFDKDEADKRFTVLKKVFDTGETIEFEVRVPLQSGDTFYLTSVKPVFSEKGSVETVICTSKNITKRKLAEFYLQDEHDRLLAALEEIKTLSGLVPICASCKKIRDDEGYWEKLEAYLVKHSGVEFTHCLCPSCMEALYGKEEWYKKSQSNPKTTPDKP